jgi:hypothetical protein
VEELLRGELTLEDFPFSYDDEIPGLSISTVSASSSTRLDLGLREDLSGTGEGRIELTDLSIGFTEERSRTTEALREILGDVDKTTFDFTFTFEEGTMTSLEVSTDLDKILGKRVGDYLETQAEEAATEAEHALYEALGPELAENSEFAEGINSQGRILLEQENRTATLEGLIEQRRSEGEAKLRAQIDSRTKEIQDKAGETLKDLGKDLKIPSF